MLVKRIDPFSSLLVTAKSLFSPSDEIVESLNTIVLPSFSIRTKGEESPLEVTAEPSTCIEPPKEMLNTPKEEPIEAIVAP